MKAKQRFILAATSIEAFIYSVFIALAMLDVGWFRIDFYWGAGQFVQGQKVLTQPQVSAINSLAVIDVVYAVGIIFVLGELHRYLQEKLTQIRPEGADINSLWAWADLITSMVPVLTAALFFFIGRSYAPWWWHVQTLYALIIFSSVRGDVFPSIKYFWRNVGHLRVKLVEPAPAPAAPAQATTRRPAPTPPPAALQPAPAGAAAPPTAPTPPPAP